MAIRIDGGGVVGDGLDVTGGAPSTIRGLSLTNFTNNAIQIQTPNNVVVGNFIGTGATGLVAAGNANGVYVSGGNTNTIGGTTAADRNVIAGNTVGVRLDSMGNVVKGNYIGTDRTGLAALANTEGVAVFGFSNTIGGTTAFDTNTISGNTQSGVLLGGGGTNTVQRNFLGVSFDGGTAVPNANGVIVQTFSDGNAIGTPGNGNTIAENTGGGIQIQNAVDTTVESNTIVANGGDGIFANTGTDNATFAGNSMADNGGLGIDLAPNGLTGNDADDPDSGPNDLQNFPEVGNVIVDSGGSATVELFLDSTASTSFEVELYTTTSVTSCDGSGNGEGEAPVTTATVNTNASGDGGSKLTGITGIAPGQFVTATATSPDGDTSEFSACFTAKSSILVDTTADSGAGSLRQGILDANSAGGADLIEFDIAGAGPHAITPITPLPDITGPTTIDGTTEPDWTPTELAVEVDGSVAAGQRGLRLETGSAGSTIRGLAVDNWDDDGIEVFTNGNTVAGNFIGAGTDGQSTGEDNLLGMTVTGDNNTIGGTTAADRNVISGNLDGLTLANGAEDNTVQGNYFGVDVTGAAPLANLDGVVVLSASSNTIGGAGAGEGNVISGNTQWGLFFDGSSGGTANVIKGNYVGLAADGDTPIGNGTGMSLQNLANNNQIGGLAAGEGNVISGNSASGLSIAGANENTIEGNLIGRNASNGAGRSNGNEGIDHASGDDNDYTQNVIAHNSANGVKIVAGTGNNLSGNRIFANGDLGISLENNNTVLLNDAGDGDTGPNNKQNFPVITRAGVSGGSATISGTLNSTPSTTFEVEAFSQSACDASGNGEGETSVGTDNSVTTNGAGNATFEITAPSGVSPGDAVTTTATRTVGNGDTSEFSQCSTATSVLEVTQEGDAGDGTCDATCTLRDAMLGANVAPGHDVIEFDIPGAAPYEINPATALPPLSDQTTIDGTTEPDFSPPSRVIEIDGTGLPPGEAGIRLGTDSDNSTIKGLAINRFDGSGAAGIAVGSDDNTIVGNYLGTGPAGATDLGNEIGLTVTGHDNTIGSTSAADANVLSGNDAFGALISSGDRNTLQGNLIGLAADGTTSLGNDAAGLSIQGASVAEDNVVGGIDPGERNVISANGLGVYIDGDASGTDLDGNLIGTNAAETASRPNTQHGVLIENGDLTTVRDNLIANSGLSGVRVTQGSNNVVSLNRIRDNGGLGIDLVKSPDGNDVVTPNDAGDADTGPNALQNFPVITSAVVSGGTTTISGTLNSTASGSFSVEAFKSSACDASGNGEGEEVLGVDSSVTTNGSGNGTFQITASGVTPGDQITVTANRFVGGTGTSEFSACATATGALVVNSAAAVGDGTCDGTCTFSDALDDAFAPGASTIEFNIPGGAQTLTPSGSFGSVPTDTTIDATTQGGSTATVKGITLDGSGAPGADGLQLSGGNDVSGLAIRDFDGDGIDVSGSNNTVAGNYIGTSNDGLSDAGNGQYGVRVSSGTANVIGGTTVADRNVISGNTDGIGVESAGTEVDGNHIGVDRTGDAALPNSVGVKVLGGSGGSSIGGSTVAERNVISGNTAEGVLVNSSDNNTVRGNHVGVGATESTDVPNGSFGVLLFGTSEGNEIGGLTAGEGNLIAENGSDGVAVAQDADDNSIHRNRMRGNGGLGIDLDYVTNGVTDNDTGDGDPGANGLQNFPVITTATATASTDTVSGTLNSLAGATFRIEAFVSDSCDPSGNGEGTATFGAPVTVSTNATTGNAPFEIAGTGINPGDVVTALATNTATGATSEFSACKTAVAPSSPPPAPPPPASADLELALTADDPTPEPGAPFNYTATLTNRGPGAAASPQVTVTLASSVRFLSALIAQSSGCSGSGRVVTCNYSTLANGEVARRRIRVLPTLSGPLMATATVSSSTPDPTPASGSTSVRAVLPKPAVAKQVNVKEVSGTVKIKQPGQGSFRTLDGQDRIRTGSLVDTTNGRVRLTSAAGGGKTQTADFFDGLFKVIQTKGKRPITELRLAGKLAGCKKASAAAKKRKGRRLWGKGKGRFRTRGKRSAALVRGTTWLVEDRCNDTTFTQVRQGVVQVRDFARKRNVTVRAGRSYVARRP